MKIKRNIGILYSISFLQGMVFYSSVSTLYRQAAGITLFQLSVIEGISLVLTIVLELPWGILADYIGYRRTMISCSFLFFLSKLVFWQADSFLDFLSERILISITIAGLSGVDSSILYLSVPREEVHRAFSIYGNLSEAGLLCSAAIYAGWMKNQYRLAGGWTVLVYGVAALLSLGIQDVRPGEQEKRNEKSFVFLDAFRQLLKNKMLELFLIAVALFQESHHMIVIFLNQLQYIKCGADNSTIAYLCMLVTFCGLAGGWSYRMTQKLGEKNSFLFLFAGSSLCCVLLAVTDGLFLSVICILLFHICNALLQPLQSAVQNRGIVSKQRATLLSVNAVFMDGTMALTDLAFGRVAEIGLSYGMLLGAVFCIISLWLYLKSCRMETQVPIK